MTPEQISDLERAFGVGDATEIRKVMRLFREFELALGQVGHALNSQWKEGDQLLDRARTCYVRSFADAALTRSEAAELLSR